MGLEQLLRNTARRALDSRFCSLRPDVRLVGEEGSGWVIQTSLPLGVCYCAGVGLGISFEQELAKIAPRPILVFDPSPTGIATMAKVDTYNMKFFPVGLAAKAGVYDFSPPKDAAEGSFSLAREGLEKVSFECFDLSTIMNRNGDSEIDVLKMDIEGFEFDIVHRFLDERIPVRQLCVEFHPWLRPGETEKTVRRLSQTGYRIIHKKRGDHTFVLVD